MNRWIVVLAAVCAGCSSQSNKSPDPVAEPPKAGPVAQARPQPKPKKAPLQIDRQLPDTGWERAADVALASLKPWLDEEPSFTRLVIKPLTAPDGSRIDHLFAYEAFSAKGSEYKASVLVVGGKVVAKDGQAAATAYLHALGFPAKPIDRGLLLEVLQLFGVEPAGDWASRPNQFGWSKVFGDDGKLGRELGRVMYDKLGATFTLYRPGPSQLLEDKHLADRLVFTFDKDAAISIASAREQQDKSWKPIPVAP
jgi:hypothetical protein